jgi:signal transduction histidine kinase
MYVRKQKGESIPHRYEFNVVRKDGEKRRVEIGSSVITDSKGNVRTVAQILDITERKEMEEKLMRNSEDLRKMNCDLIVAKELLNKTNMGLNEELSKRNAEVEKLLIQKDEFIGQLGHDLKNPLGPIVNLIPLLEKREKNPESKEILEVMHRNAGHMKSLVVKTIELARLNSPNVEMTIEDTNL